MMDLRKLALLIVACGVAGAHAVDDDQIAKLIEMMSGLQNQVSSLQNQVSSLQSQQHEPKANSQPQDCYELYGNGESDDGVYTLYADGTAIQVFCDMTMGGWTVMQKRTDDSLDYAQDMIKYQNGFGELDGEHWLGLEHVHQLTKTGHWILRFDIGDFSGETAWAEYSDFRVGPGMDFKLYFDLDSYKGNAGDTGLGFSSQRGQVFSTRDMDRDLWPDGNCAYDWYGGGGFWYHWCTVVLPTGMPYGSSNSIMWREWKDYETLKSITMKIRKV